MRAGIPLSELREEVMIEAGLSVQPGHAAFGTARINQLINRIERIMAVEDEWPGQHFETTVTVLADAKFCDLPTGITYTMIETVDVAFGSEWLPVAYGIGAAQRTIFNDSQRATPISRWEYRVDTPTQIEVWPRGSTEQTLMFAGSRTVGGMKEEADTCTLDADVIVLRCAAEVLGRDKQEDASIKLQLAMKLTQDILKRQGSARRPPIQLGRPRGKLRRPGIDFIPPGSS